MQLGYFVITISGKVPKGDPITILYRGQEKKTHDWCGIQSKHLCVCFCTPHRFAWPSTCQLVISNVYHMVIAIDISVNKMAGQKFTQMHCKRNCNSSS
jgi:hypothetical protein